MKFFNRLKLTTAYFLKFPKVWGMPVEASIEITSYCNLKCIMCTRGTMNRPLKHMHSSLFQKTIDQLAPSIELVYLHGLGEPFLNKNLFKMINYAKKKGLKVGISTNATLIDKKAAKKLLDSEIDYIIFAMDGATKETYEKIRIGGNFIQVEKNIKNFLALKKKRQKTPFVVMQFIKMPENEKEVDLFLEKWRHTGVEAVRIKPVVDFLNRNQTLKTNLTSSCFYPYRMVNIFFDGTVIPCCEDNYAEYALGNLKEKSLQEIWNGSKAQFLRHKLASGKGNEISICRQCHYPQPSIWVILGVTLFDNFTVKKILPFLERMPFIGGKIINYD